MTEGSQRYASVQSYVRRFLEHSAREAVLPLLNEGERTVSMHGDVQHLAATPLGEQVTCRARVIHSEGSVITFQMEALDEHELIARGLHKMSVIDVERISRRVERKKTG